jgi:3'-phosphoadenosine 5'-phosphosulfate sulfotransferase (PAPS reductase)/FAD synthetase
MELVINFSGGKDSTAMLAFICEKYPDVKKHVVFADTGWEHTDAETWSRSMVARFGLPLHVVRNPNKTLLTMAERRGKFPGMKQRQCTSDLKRDPINTWIRQNVIDAVVVSCIGLRSEESTGRAKKLKLSRSARNTNSLRTVWEWLPIKDWSTGQVLAYLESKALPLHPAYSYLRRFSCRICIYMTGQDLRQVQKYDPQAIDIIEKIEQKIGFTMFAGGPVRELAKPIPELFP